MVEKKLLIDGIRFTYDGPFDIYEFFKEVEDWTDENEFERETKKKLEHVEVDHKKMEYNFELWKNVGGYARVVVRLKALFREVVEIALKRGEHTRNLQKGKVLVIIDGFIETDLQHRWVQKPSYVFMRSIYEKFVNRYWLNAYDGVGANACYTLYDRLLKHFKKFKH